MAGTWFKLVVAYDGTDFHGWQRQPGLRTVQGDLEEALQKVTGEAVTLQGSGRTDSGVHALGQVASGFISTVWDVEKLQRAINALTPPDVRVLEATPQAPGFNALAHAIAKRYRYWIDDGVIGDPFSRRYCWKVWQPLDVEAMSRAGEYLVGELDFASFQTSGSPRSSTVRTMRVVEVTRGRAGGANYISVDVEATGFLYQMVRGIVGTLYQVGRGAQPPEWMAEVLAKRDRRVAGQNAPAQGLFLLKAFYPDSPVGGNVEHHSQPIVAGQGGSASQLVQRELFVQQFRQE